MTKHVPINSVAPAAALALVLLSAWSVEAQLGAEPQEEAAFVAALREGLRCVHRPLASECAPALAFSTRAEREAASDAAGAMPKTAREARERLLQNVSNRTFELVAAWPAGAPETWGAVLLERDGDHLPAVRRLTFRRSGRGRPTLLATAELLGWSQRDELRWKIRDIDRRLAALDLLDAQGRERLAEAPLREAAAILRACEVILEEQGVSGKRDPCQSDRAQLEALRALDEDERAERVVTDLRASRKVLVEWLHGLESTDDEH